MLEHQTSQLDQREQNFKLNIIKISNYNLKTLTYSSKSDTSKMLGGKAGIHIITNKYKSANKLKDIFT